MAKIDKIWIFGDYSQAEARVVAWKGPVPALKHWFQTGEDVHLNVAKMIAKVVQEQKIHIPSGIFSNKHWENLEKKDEERQVAKVTVHANNYDMGYTKFSLITGLPEMYAKLLQTIYHSQFREIRERYQKDIRACVERTRTLTTPRGRRHIFYNTMDAELFREAYAWYAQSVVGDLETAWLIKVCECMENEKIPYKIWTPSYIRARGLDARLQVHDAIGVSIPDDLDTIIYTAKLMKKHGEQSIVINNDELVIPVDFKIGKNWGEMEELKI